MLAIASTLTGQRHLASARALVPTEILLISRAEVRRLCRRHPEIVLRLREQMELRAARLIRRLTWLAARMSPGRDMSPSPKIDVFA